MKIALDNLKKLTEFGYTDNGDHYAKRINRGVPIPTVVIAIRVDKQYGAIHAQTYRGVYETKRKILPWIKDIQHLIEK